MLGNNNAIIGAGGIGSYFCAHLHKALTTFQFGDAITVDNFTVFDPKSVDEDNTLHQDFTKRYEVGHNKAAVMAARYHFNDAPRKLVASDLNNFNSFIICADNRAIRKMVIDHCLDYGKPFIDLRCRADAYAFYTDNVSREELMNSLGDTVEKQQDPTGFSCMTTQDKATRRLQMGNAAVAIAGIQLLLARWRQEPYPYKKELVTVI